MRLTKQEALNYYDAYRAIKDKFGGIANLAALAGLTRQGLHCAWQRTKEKAPRGHDSGAEVAGQIATQDKHTQ